MFFQKNTLLVKNANKSNEATTSPLSVNIANDQVTITGAGFANTTILKLKGNGIDTNLNIISKSDSQILASAAENLALLAGGTFDLIIGTADAQVTYTITFTLANNSVTTAKILDGAVTGAKIGVSANQGDFLKYNGTTWVGASVYEGQTYQGTWDASTFTLPAIGSAGDYYIVSVDGTFGSPAVAYKAGDWIITDGYNWQKVGYSKSVSSFQGRKGIVTLVPGDYVSLKSTISPFKITGSSINDLADIDLSTAPTDGQVLKYSTAGGLNKWIAGVAATSGIALTDLSVTAPLTYNSGTGAFAISAATTSTAGSLSGADKTKIDGLTAIPTSGDGLIERFSGVIAMKTCSAGEMLVWYAPTGWTCTTSVILAGTSAQTLGMSRNTTANTAGNNLTVQASGATTAATDKSGGELILSSGTSTGTGSSIIEFKTATATGTSATDNTPSTKMTILGNGNVGIGTTSPASLLHIEGPNTIAWTQLAQFNAGNAAGLGAGAVISIQPSTASGRYDGGRIYGGRMNDGSGNRGLRLAAVPWNNVAVGFETLFMDLDGTNNVFRLMGGNVGIGTTLPTSKLEVDVAGASTSGLSIKSTDDDSTNTPFMIKNSAGVAKVQLNPFIDPSLGGVNFIFNTNAAIGANGSYYIFQVQNNGAPQLSVTSAGTFVNGLVSSGSISSVINNGITTAIFGNSAGDILDITNHLSTLLWKVEGTTGNIVSNVSDGASAVGLTFNSTNSLATSGAKLLSFKNHGTEKSYIDKDGGAYFGGTVGIGTDSPNSLLSIGNASTSGTISLNGPNGVEAQSVQIGYSQSLFGGDVSGLEFKNVNGGTDRFAGIKISGSTGSVDLSNGTIAANWNGPVNTTMLNLTRFGSARLAIFDDVLINNNVSLQGNGSENLALTSFANVGIGTTSPTTTLQVAGEISPSVDNTYALGDALLRFTALYATNGAIQTSDARLKKDIQNTDLGLDFINQLRPVSYYWKSGPDKELHYGLIAQETEKILLKNKKQGLRNSVPIVDYDKKNDRYGLKYTEFIAPLIKAVQDLFGQFKGMLARVMSLEGKSALNERTIASVKLDTDTKILKIEAENEKLKKENEEIKARIKKIEKILLKTR